MDIAALICSAAISFVVPVIIWLILIIKKKEERVGIIMLFILGALFYVGMQWGIKQNGLSYLFNHTDFTTFMNKHYIPYLFVVALAGALLAVIPEWIVIHPVLKGKITFTQAIAMGLGYTAAESTMLIGYQSVMTIISYYKNSDDVVFSTGAVILSVYERILMTIIGTGLIVIFIYFVEQKMDVRGIVIKVLCQAFVLFFPGFFIAFSTTDYLEVFDRSITLVMVYVLMTAAAVSAFVIMNSLKWKMYEK